jgi:hypothetical protein
MAKIVRSEDGKGDPAEKKFRGEKDADGAGGE